MTGRADAPHAARLPAASPLRIAGAVMRVAFRLTRLFAATVACYCALLAIDALARLFPAQFESRRRPIALAWVRQLRKSIGQRAATSGPLPRGQVFLVLNHVTWQDFLVQDLFPQGRLIAMDSLRDLPILGRFFRALDYVFVSRRREEVAHVNAEIRRRLIRGQSLLLAPEGVISPGRAVQRFRAALLESVAQDGFPVHYAAVHYHTPRGWPPPSRSVLFGPDPYYRTTEGKIPHSQLEMWGPPRPFLPHLLRLLSLPYHRFTLTLGRDPIVRGDRIDLANALHEAVSRLFHPID